MERDPWDLFQVTEFKTPKDRVLLNVGVVSLSYMKMDIATLQNLFAIFPNLSNLRMEGCRVSDQFQAVSGNLKKFTMVDVHVPELLDGFASFIEVLLCHSNANYWGLSSYAPSSDVNFVCITSLTLGGYFILSDEALELFISRCPVLEYLNLRNCFCLRQIKIASQGLKTLTITSKSNLLKGVLIEAPNLTSFAYDGPCIEFFVVVVSPNLVCQLNIGKHFGHPRNPVASELRDVIRSFTKATTLTLSINSSEKLIFATERGNESSVTSWCDWSLLTVISDRSHTCEREMEGLLFISRCYATISIKMHSSSIQLKFADPTELDMCALHLGTGHDCIRDHLVKASFENFGGTIPELRVVEYFLFKAKQLKNLVIITKGNLPTTEAMANLTQIRTDCVIMIISN